jgi:hypothetical protein
VCCGLRGGALTKIKKSVSPYIIYTYTHIYSIVVDTHQMFGRSAARCAFRSFSSRTGVRYVTQFFVVGYFGQRKTSTTAFSHVHLSLHQQSHGERYF